MWPNLVGWKNSKNNRTYDRGHTSKIVTFWHRHNCHTLSVTGTKPVSVSAWNLGPNGSKQYKTKQDSRVLTTRLLGRTSKLSLCLSQLLLINFIFDHFSEPGGNQRLPNAECRHNHLGNPPLSLFTAQTSRPSQVPTTLTSRPWQVPECCTQFYQLLVWEGKKKLKLGLKWEKKSKRIRILFNSFSHFSPDFSFFFPSHTNSWGNCVQHSTC